MEEGVGGVEEEEEEEEGEREEEWCWRGKQVLPHAALV